MKKLSKASSIMFGACLCLMFMAAESKACLRCEVMAGQWFCVAGEGGGSACKAVGPSCTVTGICLGGDDRVSPGNCKVRSIVDSLLSITNSPVSISDAMIREVGASDARLALALIYVRDIKIEFDVAQVNFTSFEYTFDDVENHLIQVPGSSYFEQLELRIRDSYAKNPGVITYNVLIAADRAGGIPNLSVWPADGGRSIELELRAATFGESKDFPGGLIATSYRIR